MSDEENKPPEPWWPVGDPWPTSDHERAVQEGGTAEENTEDNGR